MAGISIPVGIKNAQFKAGLDDMRKQAKGFASDIKGEFLGGFSGIKASIVGAFGLSALAAGVGNLIEKFGKVQDVADRLGESAESVQRVGQVAQESGSDIDTLAKAMSKLTVEANKATQGGTEQAAMFTALGINAREFRDMGLEEKMVTLAGAWERNSKTGEGTAQMMELLGNRAQELIPMLIQGPEALAKALSEVDAAGNGTVATLAAVGDAWERFQQGVVVKNADGLIVLTKLAQHAALLLHTAGKGIVEAMDGNFISRGPDGKSEINTEHAAAVNEIWNPKEKSKPKRLDAEGIAATAEADKKAADKAKAQRAATAEQLADRQQKLDAAIEKAREDHRLAAMSDEERLLALRAKSLQLTIAGGGVAGRKAQLGGSYENNILAQSYAAREDATPSARQMTAREGAQETAEKVARLEESMGAKKIGLENAIAKLQEQHRLAAMSDAERLLALQEKQNRLIAAGWPKDGKGAPGEKQLEARKAALEMGGEIKAERAKIAEKKAAKKSELDGSLAAEKQQRDQAEFDKLNPAQKRASLKKKQDGLWGDAKALDEQGKPLEASEKRLAAAELDKELTVIQEEKKTKAASVTVSSLQSVGGGGGIGASSDPQLKKLDSMDQKLERIARAVESRSGSTELAEPK